MNGNPNNPRSWKKLEQCRITAYGGKPVGVGNVVMPIEWLDKEKGTVKEGCPEWGVVVDIKQFTCYLKIVGAVKDGNKLRIVTAYSHAGSTCVADE